MYRDGASLAAAAVRAERDMRKHARKEAAVIRQLAAREEVIVNNYLKQTFMSFPTYLTNQHQIHIIKCSI